MMLFRDKLSFNPTLRTDLFFLLAATIFLYLHVFALPFTPIFFEGDNLVHLTHAMRMEGGEVVFRDFFIVTLPGTELVYLLFIKIFGGKIWITNAVILLLGLSSVSLCLYLSKKVLQGWMVYLPSVIFLCLGFRQFGIDGTHRLFGISAVLLAVLLLAEKTDDWRRLCLAGALCGVASWFTQPRGLVGLSGLIVFLFWQSFQLKKSWRQFFLEAIYLVVPFAIVLLSFVAYFMAEVGVQAVLRDTVIFNAQHYSADTWNSYHAYLKDLPPLASILSFRALRSAAPSLFYYALIPFVYFVFFVVLWRKRKEVSSEQKTNLMLIGIVGLFLALGTNAPTSGRLYQIAIPGLILLCWLLYFAGRWGQRIAIVAGALLILLGTSYAIQRQLVPKQILDAPAGKTAFLSPEMFARYEWVNNHTNPGDYVFEPYQPAVYFLLHLKNPTPIYIVRPTDFTPTEHVDSIMNSLEKNPPRYILWDSNWTVSPDERKPDNHLGPLIDFIQSRYRRVMRFTNYEEETSASKHEFEAWERID